MKKKQINKKDRLKHFTRELNSIIKQTSKEVDLLSNSMQTTKTYVQDSNLYAIKRQLALATALIEEMENKE